MFFFLFFPATIPRVVVVFGGSKSGPTACFSLAASLWEFSLDHPLKGAGALSKW